MAKIANDAVCVFCLRTPPPGATYYCSSCEVTCCSQSHLQLHRRSQGDDCYPFRISSSTGVGRFVVASRDISEGEVVFEDDPLVVGPNHETVPLCLACLAEIRAPDNVVCSDCCYPFCDEECLASQSHVEECRVLRRVRPRPHFPHLQELNRGDYDTRLDLENYHLILPLRLLLLAENDPDSFSLAAPLMDHKEERTQKEESWEECRQKVVERLLPCRPSFTADSIFRAVGILDVNAYELHCTPGMAGYRALFPLGSLLSHACVANVAVSYEREPPFRATYVACTDIKAGEQVCSKYVSPLMCTLRRRPLLREDWYFDCCCRRCSDPTELGSYLGAVLCQSCRTDKKRGISQDGKKGRRRRRRKTGRETKGGEGAAGGKGYLLPSDPLDYGSPWKCDECGAQTPGGKVKELVLGYVNKVDEISQTSRYDLNAFLSLRSEASLYLHPRHEVMCDIARWSLPIMCRAAGRMTPEEWPREEVERKREMAREYLAALDKVAPGSSKTKAKLQFEYSEAALELIRRKIADGKGKEINSEESEEARGALEAARRGLERDENLSAFERWMLARIGELEDYC